MKTGPGRYVVLDGLRGVAALSIVAHHFTEHSGHTELFASAGIAVDFFFCLSGFVIAHAYQGRLLAGMPIAEYVKRRVVRLYPMYFIGLMLGIVAIVTIKLNGLTNLSWPSIANAALLNLFFLPYLSGGEYVQYFVDRLYGPIFPLNNPMWSLFFGFVANLVFAFTLGISRRAALALAAISALGLVAAVGAYGATPGWGERNFIGGFPRVFFSFFAGVVIYQFRDRLAWLPRASWPVIAALVATLAFVPSFPGHKYYWLSAALVVMPIVVAMSARAEVDPASLWHRMLLYSGRLSYPLFCLHAPIMLLASVLVGDSKYFWLIYPAYIAFVAAVAHLLMVYVDEPVRAWLGARVFSRKTVGAQGVAAGKTE